MTHIDTGITKLFLNHVVYPAIPIWKSSSTHFPWLSHQHDIKLYSSRWIYVIQQQVYNTCLDRNGCVTPSQPVWLYQRVFTNFYYRLLKGRLSFATHRPMLHLILTDHLCSSVLSAPFSCWAKPTITLTWPRWWTASSLNWPLLCFNTIRAMEGALCSADSTFAVLENSQTKNWL